MQRAAPSPRPAHWVKATDHEILKQAGKLVVKLEGKQILLLVTPSGIFACNNRCPHEGFPLSEGTLDGGATLTCNWHNWKFDLESGDTVIGRDCLRRYPVEVREDGQVWIDIADPPTEEALGRILESLRRAYGDYDYERIARELARVEKAGGTLEDALRHAIHWSHDRLEYGMTHAYGGAADWLELAEESAQDDVDRLAAAVETHAHIADDTLRRPVYPFTDKVMRFEEAAFLEAVEREDEETAIAMVRGAYRDGMTYADLRPHLATAALAHYNDFGHSAIYTYRTGVLIDRLGPDVALPLTLALVREIVLAMREDLIPEFALYAPSLAAWTGTGNARVTHEDFTGLNIGRALKRANGASGDPQALHSALLGAAAWNILHFDLTFDRHTSLPISSNISWLDFTHGVTFANAVRVLCTETPELWPQGLLQMALFAGRNVKFTTPETGDWQVADRSAFWAETAQQLFDHGEYRHIIAIHLLKMRGAVREELAHLETIGADEAVGDLLVSSLNRFFHTPMRKRHMRRVAHQARGFVRSEG